MARAELTAARSVDGVRYVDHTADIGIEVEGRSFDECLVRAAAGLFALMFVPPEHHSGRDHVVEVKVKAESPEDLLIGWLQELLYLSETGNVLFLWFESETNRYQLKGRAGGVPITPEIEPGGPAVKAVTRHDLRVTHDGERWKARFIVDV